ncbi:hypothetical protein KR074_010347 [Drosophila pseudoananassae]|nr:hypothetical protein KR074_010347 [Drosophila pseudoananassae]
MSAAGWLDMNAALQSLGEPAAEPKPNSRPRSKRRSSYAGRTAPTTGVHGRGSIGSVSAGLYKAFRERFLSSDESGDYRKLRQRDAEAGRVGANASSSTESSGEEADLPSSSSSVEDLFAKETERRKWQRKSSDQRRRAARRKVSTFFSEIFSIHFH